MPEYRHDPDFTIAARGPEIECLATIKAVFLQDDTAFLHEAARYMKDTFNHYADAPLEKIKKHLSWDFNKAGPLPHTLLLTVQKPGTDQRVIIGSVTIIHTHLNPGTVTAGGLSIHKNLRRLNLGHHFVEDIKQTIYRSSECRDIFITSWITPAYYRRHGFKKVAQDPETGAPVMLSIPESSPPPMPVLEETESRYFMRALAGVTRILDKEEDIPHVFALLRRSSPTFSAQAKALLDLPHLPAPLPLPAETEAAGAFLKSHTDGIEDLIPGYPLSLKIMGAWMATMPDLKGLTFEEKLARIEQESPKTLMGVIQIGPLGLSSKIIGLSPVVLPDQFKGAGIEERLITDAIDYAQTTLLKGKPGLILAAASNPVEALCYRKYDMDENAQFSMAAQIHDGSVLYIGAVNGRELPAPA